MTRILDDLEQKIDLLAVGCEGWVELALNLPAPAIGSVLDAVARALATAEGLDTVAAAALADRLRRDFGSQRAQFQTVWNELYDVPMQPSSNCRFHWYEPIPDPEIVQALEAIAVARGMAPEDVERAALRCGIRAMLNARKDLGNS